MTKQQREALAVLGTGVGVMLALVGGVLKVTHDLAWALLVPGALLAILGLALLFDLTETKQHVNR
jgi:hypothetical protein